MTSQQRVGWAVSALVALFLLFDAATGLFAPQRLAADMAATGFTAASLPAISLVAAVAAILYVVPRTGLLGAILVTGFLGGAICTHFRVGEWGSPPQILCLVIGLACWTGLYLREPRLRALLPVSA